MVGTFFRIDRLRGRHDDRLIVRVRPSAATLRTKLQRRHRALGAEAPGLAALLAAESSGSLHHVIAMRDDASAGRRKHRQVAAAVHATTRPHPEGHHHERDLFVHFTHARHAAEALKRLAHDPHVEAVEYVAARYAWRARPASSGSADASLPVIRLWNHAAVRLPEARALGHFREPRAISVAVLDSGVDVRHPDLAGRITRYVTRYPRRKTSREDVVGHGTHVAGIIGARRDSPAVGGMCDCRLSVYKVFSAKTSFEAGIDYFLFMVDPLLYRAALRDCIRAKIDVINLSLGGPSPPDEHEASLMRALQARGTTVVAAMGNAETDRDVPSYPAAIPGVIAVGALRPDDNIASFSCRGRHIALAAPGLAIWSTLPRRPGAFGFPRTRSKGRSTARANPLRRNTHFDAWPGTSMACPQVTAAVAMLLATKGRMSPASVRERLMRTADRVSGMGRKKFTRTYGAGRLNIERLLTEGAG